MKEVCKRSGVRFQGRLLHHRVPIAYNQRMDLTVNPSPVPEIKVGRYDASQFPKFCLLFEPGDFHKFLGSLTPAPEEAASAVVIENGSSKDITAIRYFWRKTLADGSTRKTTASSDSYFVDVYHPVLKSHDRKLVCPSTTVDESLIDHVLKGGGCMGGRFTGGDFFSGLTSLRFEIDMILFEDGEIAGLG